MLSQGTPQAWISLEHVALHVATGSVAWVDGVGPLATLRGGFNVARGRQSIIDVHPIIALHGASKVNLFGQLGIIPGSMCARSYIVRDKGHPDFLESCSHGAGRAMSLGEAKRRFTLADRRAATEGIECRKDTDVIDETPAAYKDIDAVMEAQHDLVAVVHTLKQVVCVKG